MRGIDPETRELFQLAARKRGLTVGRLADDVMRKAAEAILQEDVADMRLSASLDNLARRVAELEKQTQRPRRSRHRRQFAPS